MLAFALDGHEQIALCDLLKVTGLSSSGGEAKQEIAAGKVTVDGVVELRKRCKVRAGQVVAYAGHSVCLTA